MPPELLNRIDEVIVFAELSMSAITEIAKLEIEVARQRLAQAGWLVHVGDGVAEWLVETGYDPVFGARHLQRNIERELLTPLAALPTRQATVQRAAGRLEIRPSEDHEDPSPSQ